MANNAAMAAAEQAQINVEQSKLPLFHGDKSKDQFTGDQWLERFENAREAGNWNAARTTSYFYNSMRGLALRWYRMLSVAKVNVNDYEQLRTNFVNNYGVQVSNKIVIADFNNLKQKQSEPVAVRKRQKRKNRRKSLKKNLGQDFQFPLRMGRSLCLYNLLATQVVLCY